MIKKILASVCAAIVLLMHMVIPVYAQLDYDTNTSIILTLGFSSNGASCYANIDGDNSATAITDGTLTLTDSSGTVVEKWENLSSPSSILIVSKTAKGVTAGNTYTLTITATVKTNHSSESVTKSITRSY